MYFEGCLSILCGKVSLKYTYIIRHKKEDQPWIDWVEAKFSPSITSTCAKSLWKAKLVYHQTWWILARPWMQTLSFLVTTCLRNVVYLHLTDSYPISKYLSLSIYEEWEIQLHQLLSVPGDYTIKRLQLLSTSHKMERLLFVIAQTYYFLAYTSFLQPHQSWDRKYTSVRL